MISVLDDTHHNQHPRRIILPLLILGCGGLLMFFGLDVRDLRAWLGQQGPWGPIVFMLAGILSLTLLVPKTVVSITAGALLGTVIGSLAMLVIAVAAAALNYSIARWWLFDSICHSLSQTGQGGRFAWLRAVRDLAAEAGFCFHLLMRLSPVPTTLISYTMGASGSRLQPFLLAAAVAVIPQTLWVHGGTAATMINDAEVSGLRWLSTVVSVLAAGAVSVIVPKEAMKRIKLSCDRSLNDSHNSSGVTD